MQCECGGETVERQAVASSEGKTLKYLACRACGKQGHYRLLVNGAVVVVGEAAKEGFTDNAEVVS